MVKDMTHGVRYFRQKGPDQNYKALLRDKVDELMERCALFLVETMKFVEIVSFSSVIYTSPHFI